MSYYLSYILCPMFYHILYVLRFIIHSMSYVLSYILRPAFHHTFYALCFITHSMTYVLSHILCPMFYHTFYVLCFVTYSTSYVLSYILCPTFYSTFYALWFIIHSTPYVFIIHCMSNVNKFSSNSYSQFVKHSLLPNNEPHYFGTNNITVYRVEKELNTQNSTHFNLRRWSCKAWWSLYVPPGLTFNSSTFCPHSVFMCFVWIWKQTAIISLYNINWLVFIPEI